MAALYCPMAALYCLSSDTQQRGGGFASFRTLSGNPAEGECLARRRRNLVADEPARGRSLTMRRLLVRASSRSIAEAMSLGGGSVDQRLPRRWTSPRRSRSCSRASVLSLLSPAARAAIAVENEPGILRSAARRRSVRRSVRRSPARGSGGESGLRAARADSDAGAGLRPTGGSSPKRARQLPHKTTGSRSAGRTISNRRHPRPDWQMPQRRPARSMSVRSSVSIGFIPSP